ncbi:MAG: c-type cytochrome [Halieaceae bacterium]|nr:c-type cytochrome [Halieaceae bacterium]
MNKWLLGVFLGLGFAGHGQTDAVAERYLRTCAVCHESGIANAPRTGSPEEWVAPLAKGMDALLQSIKQGLNAMPPKGMCYDCSAAEYQALIEYMAAAR